MQLDHVAVEMLKKIAAEPGMSVRVLCERMGLAPRGFYHRRTCINDWLTAEGLTPLPDRAHQGLYLPENETREVIRKLGQLHGQHYKLSAEERRDHILLHLACSSSPLFTQHLSQINRVSRNTTLDDLTALKTFLSRGYPLSLSVTKKQGYQLTGNRLTLRTCIQQLLQRTLKYADVQAETRISQVMMSNLAVTGIDGHRVQHRIRQGLTLAEKQLQRTFTDKDRRMLHYMMMFSLLDAAHGNYPEFTPAQRDFLREQSECETAAMLSDFLAQALPTATCSANTMYFTLLFCASKNLGCHPGDIPENHRLLLAVRHLITQFQANSGVYLSDISQLEFRLVAHLGPALRRCLFNMRSENVLREEVIRRYPLIFRICRQIIVSLELEYQVTFDDNELSYVAISFAAWLDRRPETSEKQIVLVTEGGLSSTALLENQLRHVTVLPLNILHRSLSQLRQQGVPPHSHLVVSTVALPMTIAEDIGFIQTRHLMTEGEKQQLRSMLENSIRQTAIPELVNELVSSASRHVPQDREALHREFSAIIAGFFHQQSLLPSTAPGKNLADHLQQRVQFSRAKQSAWRQVIRKAAQPLINEGIIDRYYAHNIIKNIEKSGISSYLTADILLLHSAPPAGSESGALSLLKLQEPLHFDVPGVTLAPRLIVILVPAENLSHITLLESFNALISNEAAQQALLQASSLREVKRCIGAYG